MKKRLLGFFIVGPEFLTEDRSSSEMKRLSYTTAIPGSIFFISIFVSLLKIFLPLNVQQFHYLQVKLMKRKRRENIHQCKKKLIRSCRN
jgi:hypothetical protein